MLLTREGNTRKNEMGMTACLGGNESTEKGAKQSQTIIKNNNLLMEA